jgi:sulfite oxidase
LLGERWIAYHEALGGGIAKIPDYSWERVLKEKASNMTHILAFPYNGEADHETLAKHSITPNEHHFVRNHGGVPKCINHDEYTLTIEGLVKNPVTLKLKDLKDPKRFPQRKLAVTLQCAGTRRSEQIAEYPGDGDELINAPWTEGAISNAVYTGVSLKKVLKIASGGITLDPKVAHCEFFGADTYFKKNHLYNYAVSIPYSKVRHDDVILAWEMNGEVSLVVQLVEDERECVI